MKKVIASVSILFVLALFSCRVTFITGYDSILDETVTGMKKEFNLHFIRLSRTLRDNNPDNQLFEHFQDYYDNMEASLIILRDRAKFLTGKPAIVKQQVENLDKAMHLFETLHQRGFRDDPSDDHHDIRDNINSAMDAITLLQASLKTTGKPNSPQ